MCYSMSCWPAARPVKWYGAVVPALLAQWGALCRRAASLATLVHLACAGALCGCRLARVFAAALRAPASAGGAAAARAGGVVRPGRVGGRQRAHPGGRWGAPPGAMLDCKCQQPSPPRPRLKAHRAAQESVSRGLAAAYDLADGATRSRLLEELVGTLSGELSQVQALHLLCMHNK